MNIKLLDRTLRFYIVLSLVVMTICAPLFYFISNRLFMKSADETLYVRKKDFMETVLPGFREKDISDWNRISRDIRIEKPIQALQKDSVFFQVFYNKFENENENHRVLLSPVKIEGVSYILFAKVNLIESEDLIFNIALLFCIVLLLLLTGLYIGTRRLSNKIWLPFYSTLHRIEQFDLDKNERPGFESTDIEEFSRLNQSIERLIDRNLLNYKNQKEFVENAAHELQTPLAVFQAKLDVLTQQVPLTNELGITLTELNKTISMLNRMNKNLLLLSKIETHPYNITESVLISEMMKAQVLFLTEQAEEKKVTVHSQLYEPVNLVANGSLFEILVTNLLLNALRHNYSGGEIRIELTAKSLSISNTSKQLELKREKLFQRFSNAGSEGNGLGLAIVKKIGDLHGWSINYSYQNERHAFEVVF